MKIIRGFKVRGFILAAAFSAGLCFGTSASAQVQHSYLVDLNSKTVTDIGTLGGTSTGTYTFAHGINDAGQVVGTAGGGAFITGPDGMGMRDLGNLGGGYSEAYGINDAGQVVGNSGTAGDTNHAFITGPNGMGMRDLGTLPGSIFSLANGINAAGQVAGQSVVGATPNSTGAFHAFITSPNGMGMRDLSTVRTYSAAFGINDAGQVTGEFYTAGGAFHAFITGPNGMGMRDLGALGDGFSTGRGINAAGQVVGGPGVFGGGFGHAFITGPDGMDMRDLGTLGGAYNSSTALGINDAGQVVGDAYTAEGVHHAFITGPDGAGMMDLNSVVDVPDGVILTQATGINNSGQVIAIGIGIVPEVPEPEVYALFLAGLGLIGFMARRKKTG